MNDIPDKPDKQKDQISELWDACFNHLPTHIRWLNVKVNFILAMIGVVMAMVAVSIIVAVNI